MFRGLTATLFALLLTASVGAAPIPRDPPKGGPHFVLQIKPLAGWLDDLDHVRGKLKDILAQHDFPNPRQLRGAFDQVLPNWRKVFDPNRPWGMYAVLQADVKETRPVFVFPVEDPKAFGELIAAAFTEPSEEKDGIRQFQFKFLFGGGTPAFFRFKHDCAYVTLDNISAIQDSEKLPHPKDIFVKDDTALISARLFVEGIPAEVKKEVRAKLDEIGKNAEGQTGLSEMFLMGLIGATDSNDFFDRIRRVVDEAKWFSLRLDFDRKSDELAFEFNLIPQKDCALGKEIAAFKPRKSRFAELLEGDTAVGGIYSVGGFGGFKADDEDFERLLDELLRSIHLGGEPEKLRPLAKVARNALRLDGVDVGLAVKRAQRANTICLVGAAHLPKARDLETAMLLYINFLPEAKRKKFVADAVKLTDDVKAHKLTLDLPDDAKDSFGSSDFYLTFRDAAAYFALGEGAIDRLKRMLEMKPKDGPSLLVEVNPARLAPLFELAFQKELKADWSKLFPNDKQVKLLGLHLEGGSMLRVHYRADFVDILKMYYSQSP